MSVMNFARYKQINDDRVNYREMEDATVVSNYRNVGCGDGYRIYLKIDSSETVTDASYTTTGCGFGIVALAMATEFAKGKTIEQLKSITSTDIESMFEFPEREKTIRNPRSQPYYKRCEITKAERAFPKKKESPPEKH